MLGAAAAKLDQRPELAVRAHLAQGDMTNFDLSRKFALIIIAARSSLQHDDAIGPTRGPPQRPSSPDTWRSPDP
ncbi:MAG: hypothetical protein R3D25_17855 [Geminicoccaceae bacterium]